MLYRNEGIVLKSIEYGDADKIVTIYTKNYGKVQAIAKGVRKTKSKFGSSLEILTDAIFLFYKGKNIDIISQTEILESFFSTCKDVKRFAFASNCAEIINKLTEERDTNIALFTLLKNTLHYLKKAKDPQLLNLAFKWKAITNLGYRPLFSFYGQESNLAEKRNISKYFSIKDGGIISNNSSKRDSAEYLPISDYFIDVVKKIIIIPISTLAHYAIPESRLKELDEITETYLLYHSDKIFKTRSFLESL